MTWRSAKLLESGGWSHETLHQGCCWHSVRWDDFPEFHIEALRRFPTSALWIAIERLSRYVRSHRFTWWYESNDWVIFHQLGTRWHSSWRPLITDAKSERSALLVIELFRYLSSFSHLYTHAPWFPLDSQFLITPCRAMTQETIFVIFRQQKKECLGGNQAFPGLLSFQAYKEYFLFPCYLLSIGDRVGYSGHVLATLLHTILTPCN